MRHRFMAIIVAGLLVLLALPAVAAAAECELAPGFAVLRDLIAAAEGPDKVGTCVEDAHTNPENGDTLQRTTGGLLVLRQSDYRAAFTDGYRTWINTPDGLQSRGNAEHFDWEGEPLVAATYIAQCANGSAVPDPQDNPGLVADCAALLQGRDVLAGSATLNWRADRAIVNWQGLTVSGSPRRVTALTIGANPPLTGTIPPQLGALTALEDLDISASRLTGTIPPQLGNLANLRLLDLRHNLLTGSIPPELGALTNLVALKFQANLLTGPIPPQLGNLAHLDELDLHANRLAGPIPPELGNLTKLEDMIVDHNHLSGPIPPELGNLANAQQLELDNNALTGAIPPELGNLARVEELDLDHNRLSGPIPPELGNLAKLEELELRYNRLSGPIPPELGNLAKLKQLDLRHNALTGPVPPELGNLPKLRTLFLYGNAFTGCLPAALRHVATTDFATLDDLPFCES